MCDNAPVVLWLASVRRGNLLAFYLGTVFLRPNRGTGHVFGLLPVSFIGVSLMLCVCRIQLVLIRYFES